MERQRKGATEWSQEKNRGKENGVEHEERNGWEMEDRFYMRGGTDTEKKGMTETTYMARKCVEVKAGRES